jgi:hypothetical protein
MDAAVLVTCTFIEAVLFAQCAQDWEGTLAVLTQHSGFDIMICICCSPRFGHDIRAYIIRSCIL